MYRAILLNRMVACATLALLVSVALAAPVTQANGGPVTVVLSYLDGVSNFGPRSATGVAELVKSEGEIRLTTTGLQRLNGEEYRLWISNTGTGQRLALVSFNATSDGRGAVDLVLPDAIPDAGWNLMFLSVEESGSRAAEPSSRRSIAGRFPEPGTEQGRPGQLPRTGGSAPLGFQLLSPLEIGLLVGLIIVAAGIGFRVGRRQVRGRIG